ncbi:fdxN element excision controlling factor protein [Calothrix sp. NIES-4071]|nr:fdxN element excision controlling factor protein [Calothrix sp. NIES-4071]BAZ55312.1 fdxN element excision controlling factor protein [Calothrix sp. NIES-4105]
MNIPESTNNVIEHREIVKQVILHHASLIPKSKTIEIVTKFDDSNNQYALVKTGWKKGREINEILILVILRGKGVEIRVDKTKKRIAKDLIRQGINKDYIALPRSFFNNLSLPTTSVSGASYIPSNKSGKLSIYIIFFLFLLITGVVLAFLLRYNYLLDKFSFFGASIVLAFGIILSVVIWTILDNLPNQLTYIIESNYQTAVNQTSLSQDKVKPTWDISITTLLAYFNRNLQQIDWIFRLSVITMLCGFGLVAFTIALVYQKPSLTLVLVGSISGTVTQIISVIFLFIYRSTIIQANKHVETLITTNYIGMAMQILDGVKVQESETLDKLTEIKIEIAKLLLANAQEIQKANDNQPRRRRRRRNAFISNP